MNSLNVLEMFHPTGALAAVRASGDCMQPDIHNGDILLIDTQCTPQSGNAVVFIHDGQQFCKYYYPQHDGTAIMQPADIRRYNPMILKQADITFMGTVISVIHEMPSKVIPAAMPGDLLPKSGAAGNAVLVWQRNQQI